MILSLASYPPRSMRVLRVAISSPLSSAVKANIMLNNPSRQSHCLVLVALDHFKAMVRLYTGKFANQSTAFIAYRHEVSL